MSKLDLKMKKRLLFLLLLFSFLFVVLVVRVAYLQLLEGSELAKKAFVQKSDTQVINPERGKIYDRNGNTLAIDAPVKTIVANPKIMDKSEENLKLIAETMESILGVKYDDVIEKLKRDTYFEIIKRKADNEIAEKILNFIKEKDIEGIYLVDDTKRYYPNNNLASHVIGFTNMDGEGLQGIEKSMEEYLKGTPGKIFSDVDASGRTLLFSSDEAIEAKDGYNVVLTIDERIQFFAEEALEEAIEGYNAVGGGIAVVMDPRNGDVLAMVSKPDFNLNNPYEAPDLPGINPETWKGYTQEDVDLLNSKVWRNKVISNTYEPGSTFKVITAAAVLEEGTSKPDDVIDDSPISISGWTIESYDGYKYKGKTTLREGLYESPNSVFVRVAQNLGIEKFYKYVRAFGFYDRTNIELPGEEKGIFQREPKEIDMAAASFGQRFNITPMQIISAYNAVANGGKLMKPRLVKELTDSEGNVIKKFEPKVIRNVISEQTSKTLKEILEGTVTEGTGKNAYVRGYRVAGKTGTAETTETGVYVASFAAFAPADNPVVTVLIALFDPRGDSFGGGTVAGPVAGKIIEQTLDYLGVERRYTEKDLEEMAKEEQQAKENQQTKEEKQEKESQQTEKND